MILLNSIGERVVRKAVAHETHMVVIQPQSDALQPKNRWFRFTRPKLLVLTLLLAASGMGLAVWDRGLPTSWTADYDREGYTQVRGAIAADLKHLLGKSFDEVTKALNLKDVPWDDGSVQQAGQYRIYHFRGFAFYVNIDRELPEDSPLRKVLHTGEELQRYGVVRLAHQNPYVRIDGLNDRQERMKRYWKAVDESCERINAEMERQRRKSQK